MGVKNELNWTKYLRQISFHLGLGAWVEITKAAQKNIAKYRVMERKLLIENWKYLSFVIGKNMNDIVLFKIFLNLHIGLDKKCNFRFSLFCRILILPVSFCFQRHLRVRKKLSSFILWEITL